MIDQPSAKTISRFWAKVDKRGPDECWTWTAGLNGQGYGIFCIGGKARGAHRVSYFLSRGEIGNGLSVCHSCDNPPCVNPAHLWVGTAQDNSDDRVRKGRAYNGPPPNYGKTGGTAATQVTRSHNFRSRQRDKLARYDAIESAFMDTLRAVRAYLPPDGIDAQTFINRVIWIVDNPEINPYIAAIEGK